jgi:hypothetical protein
MLGRLATWLRLIGQDVAYGSHLAGRALLRVARSEQRIVLTRNTRLVRRADVPLLFITGDDFREQVRQVVAAFGLDARALLFTRCTRCNAPLQDISATEASPRVPPYVAATQQRFVRCPHCRRIYWAGTHARHVQDEIDRMRIAKP